MWLLPRYFGETTAATHINVHRKVYESSLLLYARSSSIPRPLERPDAVTTPLHFPPFDRGVL